MSASALTNYNLRKVMTDIVVVSLNLFRVMIPTLIIVKIATEFRARHASHLVIFAHDGSDGSAIFSGNCACHHLVNKSLYRLDCGGLPARDGQLKYRAKLYHCVIYALHPRPASEAMISSKVGIRLWVVVVLRLATAFIFGILLAQFFVVAGWYQAPAFVNLPLITQLILASLRG